MDSDTHNSLLIHLNWASQHSLALVYNVSVVGSPNAHLFPSTYQPAEPVTGCFVGGVVGTGEGEEVLGGLVGCGKMKLERGRRSGLDR